MKNLALYNIDFHVVTKAIVVAIHLFVLAVVAARQLPIEKSPCDYEWRGVVPEQFARTTDVEASLVVSHCVHDLSHIQEWARGFAFKDIVVYSKCGATVESAPYGSRVVRLPNLGREGYAWAHHVLETRKISSLLPKDVTFFMKDTWGKEYPQLVASTFQMMMNTVLSPQGFSCGMLPEKKKRALWLEDHDYSLWHDTTEFLMLQPSREYQSLKMNYTSLTDDISYWTNKTFPTWLSNMGVYVRNDVLTPVCYGGNFAVASSSMVRVSEDVFGRMLQSLSRGGNIVEGAFAERVWALLFTRPLSKEESKKLVRLSKSTCDPRRCSDTTRGQFYGCDANRI